VYKNQKYIKLILTFFAYFVVALYGSTLFSALGIQSEGLRLFLNDIVMLSFVLWMYYSNIKEDFREIIKSYKIKKIIKNIILGVILVFLAKMFFGIIFDIAFNVDESATDPNLTAIYDLAARFPLYIAFKTMIFTVIAEQLIFRESLRECIDNKWLFVIISAFVITIVNYIFVDFTFGIPILYFAICGYFIPALAFSIVYVQNKSNIVMLMLTYFVYNLIPLISVFLIKEF